MCETLQEDLPPPSASRSHSGTATPPIEGSPLNPAAAGKLQPCKSPRKSFSKALQSEIRGALQCRTAAEGWREDLLPTRQGELSLHAKLTAMYPGEGT